jgi:hypothetical protein
MTTFHTELEAKKVFEEYYECRFCEMQFDEEQYINSMIEGTCPNCKGDDIKHMKTYTVYQHVFATDEDDAVETSFQIGNWQSMQGKIDITRHLWKEQLPVIPPFPSIRRTKS